MPRLLPLLLLFFIMIKPAIANTSVWNDIAKPNNNRLSKSTATASRWLALDKQALLTQLNAAPDEGTENRLRKHITQAIELPLPDGRNVFVHAEKSSIMEAGLANKYPDIQTWKVYGLNDDVLSGRLDFTPAGFHGMLSLTNGETVLIDPETVNGTNYYKSHQHRSDDTAPHQCSLKQVSATPVQNRSGKRLAKAGNTLHTYRLAVATTGQYTEFFGGTVDDAMAAVSTTINRVDEIYERDLSIRLKLVAENNQIIYTDPVNDPYSNGYDNLMADQNIANLNRVIGATNYDIGHVFGIGDGGIAGVGVVCNDVAKAGASTSISSPTGDKFNIDFVAHEIGHQFGAMHSFNGTKLNCVERQADTAFEPGSGSSIMAYAGICGSDNLQRHTDAFFHASSIEQITNFSHNGKGATCAEKKGLGNSNPIAKAGTNRTIPAKTPFTLLASATDADGDTLTYTWDQMDAGTASDVDIDKGDNAIIRSYLPTSSPERMIPKLSDLLVGTHTKGEILPQTSRTLNFRLAVRDGKGGVGFDDIQLAVHDTGSAFSVTSQSSSPTLAKGKKTKVTWKVANTDASPINCDKVDIGLSTNGGKSFKTIVSNVQNDGSQSITIPANTVSSTKARIKVSCSNNIFFAISPKNFSIGNKATEGSGSGGGSVLPQTLFLLSILAGFISLRRSITQA